MSLHYSNLFYLVNVEQSNCYLILLVKLKQNLCALYWLVALLSCSTMVFAAFFAAFHTWFDVESLISSTSVMLR